MQHLRVCVVCTETGADPSHNAQMFQSFVEIYLDVRSWDIAYLVNLQTISIYLCVDTIIFILHRAVIPKQYFTFSQYEEILHVN